MKNIKWLFITVLIALSFTSITSAQIQYSISNSYQHANVDGYLQTPGGGILITATPKRPTLHEVNITQTDFFDHLYNAMWHQNNFYLGYEAIPLSGSGIIKTSFRTHNIPIDANMLMAVKSRFDWYRLGYGHRINLLPNFSLTPEIEAVLLNFNYWFQIPEVASIRSYHAATIRFGLQATLKLSPQNSFTTTLAMTSPFTNLGINTANVRLNKTLYHDQHYHLIAYYGIGYQHIRYKDHQQFPNDVNLYLKPYAEFGLQLITPTYNGTLFNIYLKQLNIAKLINNPGSEFKLI